MTGLVIWDFDGTLAQPSQWSHLLLDVLLERMPQHDVKVEDIRPHLSSGFPWHEPERFHPELTTPAAWWQRVERILSAAVESIGVPSGEAASVAHEVRRRYVDPSGFTLFDDAAPVLRLLREQGWEQVILTNHVPEFRQIAEELGIASLVDAIVNSAETGVEKPHPQAFHLASSILGRQHEVAWMIGDSYLADITGAENVGLRAILVRNEDARAGYHAGDLYEAAELVQHFAG